MTNDLLRGPLGEVFDQRQLITGVSGSGNNWAHGHHHYGPRYREELLEKVRGAATNLQPKANSRTNVLININKRISTCVYAWTNPAISRLRGFRGFRDGLNRDT